MAFPLTTLPFLLAMKWFEKRELDGQALVCCTIPDCKKKGGYKFGSMTSGLPKHVHDTHPEVLQTDCTDVGTGSMDGWVVATPGFEKTKAIMTRGIIALKEI